MSGGHFDYQQSQIRKIADEIERLILSNSDTTPDKHGDPKGLCYTPETMAMFQKGYALLREAEVYVQRIDWLVSGDDGEDRFHVRLREDLGKQWCKRG